MSYGKEVANSLESRLTTLTFGSKNPSELNHYGADENLNIQNMNFETTSNMIIAKISADFIKEKNITTIIISNTNAGKAIAPLIAHFVDSGIISNAIDYPEKYAPLTVLCKVFSGKAHAKHESNYHKNMITILPNSIGDIKEISGDGRVINIDKEIDNNYNLTTIHSRNKSTEKIALPDAEIVVSAGRGLKNAENWGMIEELAESLSAATACSKPVSDMGWRPHSEHVGQTGIAINPKLYIAIGISGAIQHLAGVNGSKNIVVINTDAEAPFFKAANYGIIGDAFTVVPKLIQAIKKYKN